MDNPVKIKERKKNKLGKLGILTRIITKENVENMVGTTITLINYVEQNVSSLTRDEAQHESASFFP